jgi:hypothetical protein
MRRSRVAWFAVVLASSLTFARSATCAAQDVNAEAPKPVADEHELRKKYVQSTLGLEGAVHAALMSTWEQFRDTPPEWEQGPSGYAKRFVSDYAASAIADTTKYAVARLLEHDPSFTPCECAGFGARLRHALTAPFTARTRTGRRVVSPAIFAGAFAGNVVPASTWYPARHGVFTGLEQTASSLAAKMVIDIWKEFRPREKSPAGGGLDKLLLE